MNNIEEWHKIGNKLCDYFGICKCQRKLKTIINSLYIIYNKLDSLEYAVFTGSELLIIAILDSKTDAVTHGINIEYPTLNKDSKFWKFILDSKDSLFLEDN